MDRWKFAVLVVLLFVLSACRPLSGSARSVTAVPAGTPRPVVPTLAYISGGAVYLLPLNGGRTEMANSSWKITDIQWSPDGRLLAVHDDANRVAVLDVGTGRFNVLSGDPWTNRCYSDKTYAWSPNSMYLIFLKCTSKDGDGDLWLWNRQSGTSREFVPGVPTSNGPGAWSHDSTRVAVATGGSTIGAAVNPGTTFSPGLHVYDLKHSYPLLLGRGEQPVWSPDDGLVGYLHYDSCGATDCTVDETVVPSTGGKSTILGSQLSIENVHLVWQSTSQGTGFDRWILDKSGRTTRQLGPAGPKDAAVDAWSPAGNAAAVESVHPLQAVPFQLWVDGVDGSSVSVYTTPAASTGCAACSRPNYQVLWSHDGRWLIFHSPAVSPGQGSEVKGVAFKFTLPVAGRSESLTPLPLLQSADLEMIGLVDHDRALVVKTNGTLSRYGLDTGQMSTLVAGISGPQGQFGNTDAELSPVS